MARCHSLEQAKWGLFSLKAPKGKHLMLNRGAQSSCLKLAVPSALQGTLSTEHSPQNEASLFRAPLIYFFQ